MRTKRHAFALEKSTNVPFISPRISPTLFMRPPSNDGACVSFLLSSIPNTRCLLNSTSTLASLLSIPFSPPARPRQTLQSLAHVVRSSHNSARQPPAKWPCPRCLPLTQRTTTALLPGLNPPPARTSNQEVNHASCLPSLPSSMPRHPVGGGGGPPATLPPSAAACAPPSLQRSRT
jgi:hypothetical protein